MTQEETIQLLDQLFRFRIGDLVTMHIPRVSKRNRFSEQVLVILDRRVEHCSGGVQLAYHVRGHALMGGFTLPIPVSEFEVQAYTPDPEATP